MEPVCLLAAWFCSASNAAHAAFTGLFSLRRLYLVQGSPPKIEALEWATFQVLRRTNASLSRRAMIDDKVAADQRGHGLGVSLEVYSISGVQQKIEAAKRLESEVIR